VALDRVREHLPRLEKAIAIPVAGEILISTNFVDIRKSSFVRLDAEWVDAPGSAGQFRPNS
jgi:hypothetical protein